MLLVTIKLMLLLLSVFLLFTQVFLPVVKGSPLFPLFKDEGKIWMEYDDDKAGELNQWDYR